MSMPFVHKGYELRFSRTVPFTSIERDWVRSIKAETVFFHQGMEKGELMLSKHLSSTGNTAFCIYRLWLEWLNSFRNVWFFFCCTQPFPVILHTMPHRRLVFALGTMIFMAGNLFLFLKTNIAHDIEFFRGKSYSLASSHLYFPYFVIYPFLGDPIIPPF